MKTFLSTGLALAVCCVSGAPALAQQGPPNKEARPMAQAAVTINAVLDTQLTIEEREIVSLAEAMPEEKYSFAPTNGEFQGVRTFAQQVKHIATVNDRFFGSILAQPPLPGTPEGEGSNGPDSIQTKAEILQYLKDSFALGHKAVATIDFGNAYAALKSPVVPFLRTPVAVVVFTCAHAMDHYGQMVEYLRDNGLVPLASRQSPPANPPAKSHD
jgi:hypothetical protein